VEISGLSVTITVGVRLCSWVIVVAKTLGAAVKMLLAVRAALDATVVVARVGLAVVIEPEPRASVPPSSNCPTLASNCSDWLSNNPAIS
jgi:hypothetical protein